VSLTNCAAAVNWSFVLYLSDTSFVLAVTEKGFGKRVSSELVRNRSRICKGNRVVKFKDPVDGLAALRVCHAGDDVVLSTGRGTVIRQSINAITQRSKQATGVTVQSMHEDDVVVQVDIVPHEDSVADMLRDKEAAESERNDREEDKDFDTK
jgi:DNA gyrase/topoisomerase IV subunit A